MNKLTFSAPAKMLSTLMMDLGEYSQDVRISGVSDDTRSLVQGDIFLCLPRVADVQAMVQAARDKGAVAVLFVGNQVKLKHQADFATAEVANMQAVGTWLRRWFETEHTTLPCIGITGTDGKTSTAWMLREVLAQHLGSAWSCGTLGLVKNTDDMQDLGNTTPSLLTLHTLLALAQQADVGALVLEVSSHGIAQARIAGIPFTAAMWTTLGHDHLEDHGGFKAYRACKASFMTQVASDGGVVVANADYKKLQKSLQDVSGRVYWYANNQQADLLWSWDAGCLILTGNRAEIELKRIPAAEFHAENFAAIALLLDAAFTLPLADLAAYDGNITTPPGRLEPVGKQGNIFIDYAHTAEGLRRCLHSARALCQGRLLLVFGCGGDRDKAKRPAMGEAALLADACWLTADNPRSEQQSAIADDVLQGMQGASQTVHVCEDRQQAIVQAVAALAVDDVLVIAGKGHESYIEIKGQRLPWSDKAEVLAALDTVGANT